ncbi:MAG: hypothetical protein QM639_01140 [Rhodocyclaceae bacterium]
MLNTKLVLVVLAVVVVVGVVVVKVMPGDTQVVSKAEEKLPPGATPLPGTKGFYHAEVKHSPAKEF